jgi:hypothetical protein
VGVGRDGHVGGEDGGAESSGTVPGLVDVDNDAVGYRIVLPSPVYLQTPRLGLLDLLELTGTLVLVDAGPRVGDYHGHGGLPRPDRPHSLGSLSSQDLRVLYRCKLHVLVGLGIGEGSGSVKLLAVGGECVDGDELLVVVCEGVSSDKLLGTGNQNLFGNSMMMGHVVVVNTDSACSFVLSASQLVSSQSIPRQRPSCSSLAW